MSAGAVDALVQKIDALRKRLTRVEQVTERQLRSNRGRPVLAKITAIQSGNAYKAVEIAHNGTEKTNPPIFDDNTTGARPSLQELEGREYIGVDTIVLAYPARDSSGNEAWYFYYGSEQQVWEATADADTSSNTVTAKRVNLDETLVDPEQIFNVFSENVYQGDRGFLIHSADGKTLFMPINNPRLGLADIGGETVQSDSTITGDIVTSTGKALSAVSIAVSGVPIGYTFASDRMAFAWWHDGGWQIAVSKDAQKIGLADLSGQTVQSDSTVTGDIVTAEGEFLTDVSIAISGAAIGVTFDSNKPAFAWWHDGGWHAVVSDAREFQGVATISGSTDTLGQITGVSVIDGFGQALSDQTVQVRGIPAETSLPRELKVNVWLNYDASVWNADVNWLERNGLADVGGQTVQSDSTVTGDIVDSWGNLISGATIAVSGVPIGYTFSFDAMEFTWWHDGGWQVAVEPNSIAHRIGIALLAGVTVSGGSCTADIYLANGETLTGQTININNADGTTFSSDAPFRVLVAEIDVGDTGSKAWHATAIYPQPGNNDRDVPVWDGINGRWIPAGTTNYDGTIHQLWKHDGSGNFMYTTLEAELKNLSSYDSSKQQVPVNDNGTIKWVDLNDFTCPS